jgi:hypothetical protein
MKKVAILQSNYIPWKGYFDLIASVDQFVLYDDMQFPLSTIFPRNLPEETSAKQFFGRSFPRCLKQALHWMWAEAPA